MNGFDVFILMTVLFISIIPALWAGSMMDSRGKSKGAGWALGFFLSYLGPLIVAVFVSKDYVELDRRQSQYINDAQQRINTYHQKQDAKRQERETARRDYANVPMEPDPWNGKVKR